MFALTSERNYHMITNHEKQHGCEHCGKKFFRYVFIKLFSDAKWDKAF